MKSVNRKIVLTALLGVVLVAPFLLIASVVGIQAMSFASEAKPEVFCLLLAVASVAARISDGRVALSNTAVERQKSYRNSAAATDLRTSSTVS